LQTSEYELPKEKVISMRQPPVNMQRKVMGT
jgi:hypothetical protein